MMQQNETVICILQLETQMCDQPQYWLFSALLIPSSSLLPYVPECGSVLPPSVYLFYVTSASCCSDKMPGQRKLRKEGILTNSLKV